MSISHQRIAVILPSLGIGGAELFVKRLVSILNERYQILLIILKNVENEIRLLPSENVVVFRLELNGFNHPYSIFRGIVRMRKAIKQFKPSVIQCFLYPSELISLFLLRPKKTFWSLRGTGNPLEKSIAKKLANQLSLCIANFYPKKVIACSSATSRWGISRGISPNKIIVISNFLDGWTLKSTSLSQLTQSSRTPFLTNLKIGMAARYDSHKGHLNLMLSTLRLVEESNLRVTLSFIGTGTESIPIPIKLKDSSAFQSGKLRIELLGPIIETNQKANWFSDLDLYVMASFALEGFPNSLYEALAIGCPCIATNSGNVSDFLSSDYISNSSDEIDIFVKLSQILDMNQNKLKQDLKVAQSKLITLTNPESICESYLKAWGL
jgi:glycosyltransferase involved in cell wall biosynthesis